MFRTTTTAALATIALVAASAGGAQAAPNDIVLGDAQADVATMEASIQQQMTGNAFGWQFAIAQGGKLAKANKGGKALSAVDAPGGKAAVPMQPTMKMEIASATKTITAIATMKLLRLNNLTIESSIDPYLPPDWKRGPGFASKSVRFRHLLSHTSGINQAIASMPKGTLVNNGWDDMQKVVAAGTNVPSQRAYKNANYALLRIINAKLWTLKGGQKTVTEEFEIYNSKGIEIGTKKVVWPIPVSKTTNATYSLDFMRKRIFEPAGLTNVSCTAEDPTTALKSYTADGSTSLEKGVLHETIAEECAGARGIRLSAIQHVQLLAHLRHGDIIDPDDLDEMDDLQLGWHEDSGGGDGGQFGDEDGKPDNALSLGNFWHGGALLGDKQLHTCGMTFNDGTEASILVNSHVQPTTTNAKGEVVSRDPCSVLYTAWAAAS